MAHGFIQLNQIKKCFLVIEEKQFNAQVKYHLCSQRRGKS